MPTGNRHPFHTPQHLVEVGHRERETRRLAVHDAKNAKSGSSTIFRSSAA